VFSGRAHRRSTFAYIAKTENNGFATRRTTLNLEFRSRQRVIFNAAISRKKRRGTGVHLPTKRQSKHDLLVLFCLPLFASLSLPPSLCLPLFASLRFIYRKCLAALVVPTAILMEKKIYLRDKIRNCSANKSPPYSLL
jgi:hypothetical protein